MQNLLGSKSEFIEVMFCEAGSFMFGAICVIWALSSLYLPLSLPLAEHPLQSVKLRMINDEKRKEKRVWLKSEKKRS